MLRFFFIFSLIFVRIFGQCLDDQIKAPNNLCYRALKNRTTWKDAEMVCQQDDGHLASIGGGIMNGFLDGIGSVEFQSEDIWVGAINRDGNWFWTNGKEFRFQNWDTGHPAENSGNCLSMHRRDAKWRSSLCTETKPFICEYPNISTMEKQEIRNQTHSGKCPENWMYSPPTKKCYLAISHPDITWPEAESNCKKIAANATLVNIHSLAENSLVAGYAAAATSYAGYAMWIGLHNQNGVFQWTDGSLMDFDHFYPYNPPNGLYTYLILLDGLDNDSNMKNFCMLNRWMCTDGHGVNGYVCEKAIKI